MKFKVGDHVIGNSLADRKYSVAYVGWRGVVCWADGTSIEVQKEGCEGSAHYLVDPKCFDLVARGQQKIVITADGKTTIARLYDGKTVVKSATAKCNPKDTYDFSTGANLAYNRLMFGTDYHPDEVRISKEAEPEQLYNGKVVCVDLCGYNKGSYTVGKVYQFKDGRMARDDGARLPSDPIHDFNDWRKFTSSKFIEIVE